MSSGRYTMRGRATQGLAFAGWALASQSDAVAVVTGCIKMVDVYNGGARSAYIYRPGARTTGVYTGGKKTGQAGC